MPLDPPEEALAVRSLRRHVRRHNQQALLLAVLALNGAVVLWGLLYLVVSWLGLLIATVSLSFDPETITRVTDPDLLGPYFPAKFAVGGLLLLALASFLGRWIDLVKLREERPYLVCLAYELFMATPSVTFSIWGNLRAMVRLRRGEAVAAWRVLERMRDLGGRLRVAHVAREIEDQESLPHILDVLQLAELVGVRENEEGWFYYLLNREALGPLRAGIEGRETPEAV